MLSEMRLKSALSPQSGRSPETKAPLTPALVKTPSNCFRRPKTPAFCSTMTCSSGLMSSSSTKETLDFCEVSVASCFLGQFANCCPCKSPWRHHCLRRLQQPSRRATLYRHLRSCPEICDMHICTFDREAHLDHALWRIPVRASISSVSA